MIISLGIGIYTAYTTDVRERENFVVQSHYPDTTDKNTRLIDGCKGLHEQKQFRGVQFSGVNCSYEIAPTQWALTISNRSHEALAIVQASILAHDVGSNASFREGLTDFGPQPGFKLPINVPPHSAVEVTLVRFWPLALSKESFEECSKHENLADIDTCLGGMSYVDPDKRDRVVETLQVEFVSSSGTTVVAPLPNPIWTPNQR